MRYLCCYSPFHDMTHVMRVRLCFHFFFFNDTATTEIYTLSLHDALPISEVATIAPDSSTGFPRYLHVGMHLHVQVSGEPRDRKSTRLNSSHGYISYAVFCLKKKKKLNEGCDEARCLGLTAGSVLVVTVES